MDIRIPVKISHLYFRLKFAFENTGEIFYSSDYTMMLLPFTQRAYIFACLFQPRSKDEGI